MLNAFEGQTMLFTGTGIIGWTQQQLIKLLSKSRIEREFLYVNDPVCSESHCAGGGHLQSPDASYRAWRSAKQTRGAHRRATRDQFMVNGMRNLVTMRF